MELAHCHVAGEESSRKRRLTRPAPRRYEGQMKFQILSGRLALASVLALAPASTLALGACGSGFDEPELQPRGSLESLESLESVTSAVVSATNAIDRGTLPSGVALTCPDPELTPEDASALEPAIAAFNLGASRGFAWCRIAPVTQYSEPVCPADPIDLETVVNQVIEVEGGLRGWSFADGQVLTAAQVAAIEPFTTVCSPGGPGFAASVHANVSGATPQGWVVTSEIPCHNCHEFSNYYILWYPADGQVLVIPYVTGYDS
jgi:hypothetical protein